MPHHVLPSSLLNLHFPSLPLLFCLSFPPCTLPLLLFPSFLPLISSFFTFWSHHISLLPTLLSVLTVSVWGSPPGCPDSAPSGRRPGLCVPLPTVWGAACRLAPVYQLPGSWPAAGSPAHLDCGSSWSFPESSPPLLKERKRMVSLHFQTSIHCNSKEFASSSSVKENICFSLFNHFLCVDCLLMNTHYCFVV